MMYTKTQRSQRRKLTVSTVNMKSATPHHLNVMFSFVSTYSTYAMYSGTKFHCNS